MRERGNVIGKHDNGLKLRLESAKACWYDIDIWVTIWLWLRLFLF